MKIAAKVFLIIGTMLLAVLIVPLIIGAIALNNIQKAKSKSDISKTLAILSIIFCGVIGGVFMLLINDRDFKNTDDAKIEPASDKPEEEASENAPSESNLTDIPTDIPVDAVTEPEQSTEKE